MIQSGFYQSIVFTDDQDADRGRGLLHHLLAPLPRLSCELYKLSNHVNIYIVMLPSVGHIGASR